MDIYYKKNFCHKRKIQFVISYESIKHAAYSILHNEWQAEDAVMNAFEKMLKHEEVIDDPYSEDTKRYVICVIKNAAIDIYRKNVKERENIALISEDRGQLFHQEINFESGFSDKVAEIIKGLPREYQEVLYERYAKEKTVRETAQALHISESAVRKHQERGLKMLRERIGGNHYELC